MSTTTFLLILFGILFIWLGLTGKLKKVGIILSGFTEKFITDVAKTPEGADAIFSEAIDKQMKIVSDIKEAFKQISGEAEVLTKETNKMEIESKKIEQYLKNEAKKPDFDPTNEILIARTEQKFMIDDNISGNKQSLAEILKKQAEVKEAMINAENRLDFLRKNRERTVNELKRNKRLEKVYDMTDGLTSNVEMDKMFTSIKDGLRESQVKSIGSRFVHDNQLEVKVNRAHKQAIASDAVNYLQNLKK